MRDRHRYTLSFLVPALCALLAMSCASQIPGTDLLQQLQTKLVRVRGLPNGSRPTPPDVDLLKLNGLGRNDVRSALGAPDPCDSEINDDCETRTFWSFRWGPPNAEPKPREGYVTVSNGGPWLLVIDFAHDHVVAARWLGQR